MFRLSVAALVVSTCAVAAAQGSPTIPSWIHPGLTVIYDGVSASRNGTGYAQPVRVAVVTRVRVVDRRGVAAASLIQSVGAPVQNTIIWSCNAAGTCHGSRPGFNGKFWVDPADPTGSAAGPNGEAYRVVGTGPYQVVNYIIKY